jgi:CO/xanthine dehydrogenase FAD-binding subunit
MRNFKEFHNAQSLDEAHELAKRVSPRTAVIGGGTWLTGEPPAGIEAVVDIAKLGLDRVLEEGSLLRIGARYTLQALVDHPLFGLGGSNAALNIIGIGAEAMAALSIRNRATIGGAICTADSASPLVTALLACDAEVVTYGVRPRDEERKHEVYQTFPLAGFSAYAKPLLAQGAIVTEVRVRIPSADTRARYERVARTPKDYPIVCVAAQFASNGGIAGNMRVAVGGVAPLPLRLSRFEFGIEKKRINEYIDGELKAAIEPLTPQGDYLGSAEYRLEMARTLVRRAVMAVAD